jgi:hypothetical protein
MTSAPKTRPVINTTPIGDRLKQAAFEFCRNVKALQRMAAQLPRGWR